MSTIFCVLLAIFCANTVFAQANYHLAFSKESVDIQATIHLKDSMLYMSDMGPAPERWGNYVDNLTVTVAGKPCEVEKKGDKWMVRGAGEAQVKYRVLLKHEEMEWPGGIDGVAFVRDWGVFATGRALFLMGGEQDKITITASMPDGWALSTPWEEQGRGWEVSSCTDLTEALLFAGTQKEVVLNRGEMRFKFVLGGDKITANQEQYKAVAEKVLQYYVEKMGGEPKPYYEMKTAMVVINQSEMTDGEVIGHHISMLMNPDGDMQSQVFGWFMFAHEFFHLWNGHTLRVASTKMDWFKEGVTNYYTLKALVHSGIINEDVAKMVISNLFYARYMADSGLGEMAPADAAGSFDKDNHWGLVYGGGLFAGISIDMAIRKSSSNEKSLDDLMRNFYSRYAGKDLSYTTEDVIEEANKLCGCDLSEFASAYINGPAKLSIKESMLAAGVDVQEVDGQLLLVEKDGASDLQKAILRGFFGK